MTQVNAVLQHIEYTTQYHYTNTNSAQLRGPLHIAPTSLTLSCLVSEFCEKSAHTPSPMSRI